MNFEIAGQEEENIIMSMVVAGDAIIARPGIITDTEFDPDGFRDDDRPAGLDDNVGRDDLMWCSSRTACSCFAVYGADELGGTSWPCR